MLVGIHIPEWLLTATVAVTVFTAVFGVGLGIALGDLRWIWDRPGPMVKGLFSMLVAVPVLAVLIARAIELPWPAEVAVLLMAISPGAPAALRRSQAAGGHRAFAPSLQICAMVIAVISVPLSIVALDHVYSGHASVAPWHVARQVFVAQLLPLSLGIALRRASAPIAERLEWWFQRIALAMLAATVVIVLIDVWDLAVTAGLRVLAAIVLTTVAALLIGHWLGGPDPAMRTAVAIASAARNPGLALLVATFNAAPPQVNATVVAYLGVSVLTIVAYGAWRRHAA